MLSTKPIITYTPVSISGYRPSAFVLIDSDKGPEEITEISSLEQFYVNYGSINSTDSYNFAKKLIQLGYRLLIKRVKLNDSFTSVRLLNSSNISDVAYPGYGIDYKHITVPQIELNKGIHAFTITIDINKINKRIDQYSNVIYDYIFIGDSGGWDLIWFDTNTTPIPWHLSRKLIRLDTNGDVKKQLIDSFQYRLGYLVDDFSTSDTIITLNVKSSNEIYHPISSFDTDNNLISDEDIYCSLTDDRKILDVYSKLDNCINDISITISKWLNKYRFEVDLYNLEEDYIIRSEVFNISLDEKDQNYIGTISDISQIVNIRYYGGALPLGTIKLGRLHKKYSNKDDFIRSLDSLIINEMNIDFITDSFWYNTYADYVTDTEIISYINKLTSLRSQLQSSSILLLSYKSDDIVDKCSKEFVSYFNGYLLDINNVKYPGSLYLLELLSHGTVEGFLNSYSVDGIVDRDIVVNDKDSGVNDFVIDSYNVVELLNPLAYFNSEYLITLNELVPMVLTLNKFISDLDSISVVTESSATNCFYISKYSVENYTNTSISLDISNVVINERTLNVTFTYEADYSLQQLFDLIVPIQGIIS